MVTRDIFLFDANSQKMHVLAIEVEGASMPQFVNFNDVKYYGLNMAAGYYIQPPNEAAFVTFCEWFIPHVLIHKQGAYDPSYWQNIYENQLQSWSGFPEQIKDFLYPQTYETVVLKNDVTGVFLGYSYGEFLHEWMTRTISRLSQVPLNALEFGCGPGNNVLGLALRLPHIKWGGMDISEAAIVFATNAARHYGLPVDFFSTDGMSPHAQTQPNSYDLVFVHGVFHSLRTHVRETLRKMILLARERVLIIEPFPELAPDSPRMQICKDYYAASGFAPDIHKYLLEMEAEGLFRIQNVERLRHSVNPANEYTAIELVHLPKN